MLAVSKWTAGSGSPGVPDQELSAAWRRCPGWSQPRASKSLRATQGAASAGRSRAGGHARPLRGPGSPRIWGPRHPGRRARTASPAPDVGYGAAAQTRDEQPGGALSAGWLAAAEATDTAHRCRRAAGGSRQAARRQQLILGTGRNSVVGKCKVAGVEAGSSDWNGSEMRDRDDEIDPTPAGVGESPARQ